MKKLGLLLLLTSVIFACKKKPIEWESDWALPLINDTLSMRNWVNDSTLGVNGGFYELNLHRMLFDLDVNDLIDIPDTTLNKDFTLAVPSLIANPGFLYVSSTEENEIKIPDVQLKLVTLKSGYIDVTVRNPIPTTTIFSVKLPGVSKDGVSFNEVYSAPPGTNSNPGVVTKTINLAGYTMNLSGLSGGASNRFLSQIKVSTSTTGPTVTITNTDVTKVTATFRDVEVSYAKGYFGNQIIEETDTLDLSALNAYQSGMVDIGNTNLIFTIENGIKVSARAKLYSLNSMNSAGFDVNLNHPMINSALVVNPASGYWNTLTPSYTTIQANSGNSNIESYVENMGNKHEVSYKLELNPWGNVSGSTDEYYPHSKFRIYLDANMPLLVGMNDLVLQDTFDISIKQEDSKVKIASGDLVVRTANSFPMSASLDFYLIDELGNILHHVTGGEVAQSGLYGNIEAPYGLKTSHSNLRFKLSDAMIADLDKTKGIIARARLNTPDPSTSLSQQVQIPENAFLSLKVTTDFKTTNAL